MTPEGTPMKAFRTTGLAAGVVLAMAAAVAVSLWRGAPLPADPPAAAPAKGDYPMFGGTPQRNMVNLAAKDVPTTFDPKAKPGEGGLKWKAALGSKSYGGPTVAGGKIFVGTNNETPRDPSIKGDKGVLMCFNEADGKFLWQMVTDKLPSGNVNDWPKEGVCSTPLVEGDKLYYVSNRCAVVCLDVNGMADGNQGVQTEKYKGKTDGDVLWEYDMMKELNVFPHNLAVCSPVAVGDLLFIVTANGVDEGHINLPSPDAPSFICLNKKTGKLVWQSGIPGKKIMHGQWSNPAYASIKGRPQVLFPGGDGILYSFEPETGKLIWKFDCNPKNSKYELGGKGTRSDFIATPVIHDDLVYLGVGQDPEHYEGVGHLWCIDPSKASETNVDLTPKDDIFDPKAEVNKNSGLVWHYGGATKEGDSDRDYYFGRTMSTVAVHDGLCYAAELAGYIHCLDAKTGKAFWTHDTKSAIWGSPMWMDGKVYLGTEDGDLFIFKHGKEKTLYIKGEPKKYDDMTDDEKRECKIEVEQPLRSTPIFANGVLYLLSESTLFAVEKK
jgi:outer membrane protein assembly factor BamB